MKNSIFVIKPYKWNGMWVFDDERLGLDKEPFVAGADTMIDNAVQLKGVPNAENGFLMVFSAGPFPDADFDLAWLREEGGGNVYKARFEIEGAVQEMEGWLCPALNLYYPEAPKKLYVQVRKAKQAATAMSTEIQLYAIGHSSHPLGSFLWLLRKHRIEALVDIRRYPGSRRHPHFSRESLSASLLEEDVEYHWLEALGGHRTGAKDAPPSPNRGVEDESFRAYADYMASDEFQQGVAKLLAIAGSRWTAIMCAEGDYRHCHRRFLCDHLLANGVSVQHIFPSGEVKPNILTPGAKVVEGTVTYPGRPTLFQM